MLDLLASTVPIVGGSWGFDTEDEAVGFPKLLKTFEAEVDGAAEEDEVLAVMVGLPMLGGAVVFCPSEAAVDTPLLASGPLFAKLPKGLAFGAALVCT